MERILIVEDDRLLNKTLAYNFTAGGYDVTSAVNAAQALSLLAGTPYDLVLLDVNLPDGNGFDLCRQFLPQRPDTMVIFLTANDAECDQLRGYAAGAVDYVTKPFSVEALQQKVGAMFAVLARHRPVREVYDDGRLFLDFAKQMAMFNGCSLTLSAMEFKMLNLFCENAGVVLTRRQLLERLLDVDERYEEEQTLTTFISRLRGKLEADGDRYIKTVYGMGYQWTGGRMK